MTFWIVDTNIISETKRVSPNQSVMSWLDETPIETIFTTIVNIAEVRHGILSLSDVRKVHGLTVWLEGTVRLLFENRTLGINEETVLTWRTISKAQQVARQPTPPADLMIAAIALTNKCGIASRDVTPFVACGIPTLNPWTGERFNGA